MCVFELYRREAGFCGVSPWSSHAACQPLSCCSGSPWLSLPWAATAFTLPSPNTCLCVLVVRACKVCECAHAAVCVMGVGRSPGGFHLCAVKEPGMYMGGWRTTHRIGISVYRSLTVCYCSYLHGRNVTLRKLDRMWTFGMKNHHLMRPLSCTVPKLTIATWNLLTVPGLVFQSLTFVSKTAVSFFDFV